MIIENFQHDTNFFNSCKCLYAYSDGAAALVLVSGDKARELGLQVIAKITGYADAAQVSIKEVSTIFLVSISDDPVVVCSFLSLLYNISAALWQKRRTFLN